MKAVGASGDSAQTGISKAPVPAAAPAQGQAQAPLPAPASPPSAPASPQNSAAQGAARANTALERTMKTQACAGEAMKKLGPNALTDAATFQKTVQDCLQR